MTDQLPTLCRHGVFPESCRDGCDTYDGPVGPPDGWEDDTFDPDAVRDPYADVPPPADEDEPPPNPLDLHLVDGEPPATRPPRRPHEPASPDGSRADEADEAVEAHLRFNRAVNARADILRVDQAARAVIAAERATNGSAPVTVELLRDVLARPPEPPRRVTELIPSDAATLLVAQRKTGKTIFVLNYARSLLTGAPLLDRFDVRPVTGTVALLNFELADTTLARWANEHGIPDDRLVLVNLRGRPNPLAHPHERARLATALRGHQAEALIVDPFGRAFTGTNQNDSGEVSGWLGDLDRFVRGEVGATVLLLTAHAGWNRERSRGASALEDWADSVVMITRAEDDETQRFLRAFGRDVDVDEDRLDYHAPTRTLRMAGVGSRAQVRANAKLAELSVLVCRAAREEPGIGVQQLTEAVRGMDDAPGFQNWEIGKAARWAQERGLLRIEPGGRGRRTAHYAVEPDTPSNPFQTPSETPPTTPSTPSLLEEGVVGGGGR